MKTHSIPTDSTTSQTFLTGAILFANIDPSGFSGYAVKAIIGGAIWMAFKLAGDYLSYKILERKKEKEETNHEQEKDN